MWRTIKFSLALLAVSLVPALSLSAANVRPDAAPPGTLNYIEGQVTVAGQPVGSQSAGRVQLKANELLETAQGRAEILLSPGVFLRVGENSSIRLASPNLANPGIEVLKGQAIVEVAEMFKNNHITVRMGAASTQLRKQGLYDFNADAAQIRVFDGRADVLAGDRRIELTKGRQLILAGKFKPKHFNVKEVADEDPLYSWSNLRSEYEAEASMQSARSIFSGGGPYWYGPGWYWNPYWDMYGFIPDDGIWYSPFGWPFYSPYMAYWGGYGWGGYGTFGRYGYGHGYLARGHGHFGGFGVGTGGRYAGGRFGAGLGNRGFAGGMRGGGFGGFHGGGFGGGGRR